MILQLLQDVHCAHVMQLQHQRVLSRPFEFIPVSQDDKQALEGHLDGFVIIDAEQIDVVADDVGVAVECVDGFRVARVGHVGEDVADLAFDIVAVHVEKLEDSVDESSGADDGLDLGLGACGDVGEHPARLPTDHLLMMV